MAWMRYNDTFEPSHPNPRTLGWLFIFMGVGNLGMYAYDLWRDWQRHRFDWTHLVGLLVSLFLCALILHVARRAWKKSRDDRGSSKTA